jgi:hypothetical protein
MSVGYGFVSVFSLSLHHLIIETDLCVNQNLSFRMRAQSAETIRDWANAMAHSIPRGPGTLPEPQR